MIKTTCVCDKCKVEMPLRDEEKSHDNIATLQLRYNWGNHDFRYASSGISNNMFQVHWCRDCLKSVGLGIPQEERKNTPEISTEEKLINFLSSLGFTTQDDVADAIRQSQ